MIFWFTGAACLVLSATVFFVHFGLGENRSSRGAAPTFPQPGSTTLPMSAVNPAEVAAEPLAGTGLEILRTDGEDIFAPPGAVRRYALRRNIKGEANDIIDYTIKAEISDVEKFYSDSLTKAGYKLIQRKPAMQADGISLVFLRETQHYCVSLRRTDKEEKKMVKIVLVVSRPGL